MGNKSELNVNLAQQAGLGKQEAVGREGSETVSAAELVARAAESWQSFLGFEIDVPMPDQELINFLERKNVEGAIHLGTYYWPGKDVQFSERSSYPGWLVKPPNYYWTLKSNKELDETSAIGNRAIGNRRNQWIVIDTTPKPEYAQGNQMYSNDPFQFGELISELRGGGYIREKTQDSTSRFSISRDELDCFVMPAYAEREGIDVTKIKLPTAEQYNVFGNMYHPDWGSNQISEWVNDRYSYINKGIFGRKRIFESLNAGNYYRGGLAFIGSFPTDLPNNFIGFRPMMVFPSEAR